MVDADPGRLLDDTDDYVALGEAGVDLLDDDTKVERNGRRHSTTDDGDDPDLEVFKARVKEMEEEAEKLRQLQTEVEQQMSMQSPTLASLTAEEKMEIDARSVWVGNVDYGATAEELEQHFHGCGSVNRVTILCDKFTGHPKGFAYVEFADKDSVHTATALDESLFRGRQIKVVAKRTNRPGISSTNRPPRGRFRRRAAYSGYGYVPRGRRSRPRWFYPY